MKHGLKLMYTEMALVNIIQLLNGGMNTLITCQHYRLESCIHTELGNHPRRWERTGTVVEVRQYHQYIIRVDGTGRVTIAAPARFENSPFQTNQTHGTLMAPTAVQHPEVILSSPSTPKTRQPQVPKIPVSLSPTRILSQPAALNETPIIVPTQKQGTQTQPSQIDLDQSFHQTPEPDVPSMSKVPRALSCLQPHNKAGEKELLTPR
ncbi:unnamed protein product [Mytilus edulis]|uniref:Uncharacterized protein n=1 Tax=Mytilus edulis TaxID=6550 RepID=A0A8S3QRH0_MYTED|nr:unnamed protein product [Mytilus edulis]